MRDDQLTLEVKIIRSLSLIDNIRSREECLLFKTIISNCFNDIRSLNKVFTLILTFSKKNKSKRQKFKTLT